jgi:hypothetical protein
LAAAFSAFIALIGSEAERLRSDQCDESRESGRQSRGRLAPLIGPADRRRIFPTAWHPVSQAVGNIHHQDASLIAEIDDPAE